MRLAIVDDEKYWREEVKGLMDQIAPNACKAHSELLFFSSGQEFLKSHEECPFDLVFLDLFLGEESGLEVAEKIREKSSETAIIVMSTKNVYALECHRLNVDGYLMKPLDIRVLESVLMKIRRKKGRIWEIVRLEDGHRICLVDMLAAEFQAGEVVFHLKEGQEYRLKMKLSDLKQLLLSEYEGFVSINANCIVNLRYLKKVDTESVELVEKQRFRMPKSNYNRVKNAQFEYWANGGRMAAN